MNSLLSLCGDFLSEALLSTDSLPVIAHSAHAFILVHKHPSGDPSPSEADLRLTGRLSEAARILQIQMLDHVIIGQPMNGRQGYLSFKEAGAIG